MYALTGNLSVFFRASYKSSITRKRDFYLGTINHDADENRYVRSYRAVTAEGVPLDRALTLHSHSKSYTCSPKLYVCMWSVDTAVETNSLCPRTWLRYLTSPKYRRLARQPCSWGILSPRAGLTE